MEKSGILKNKLFLYLTEFFAGMSVMAVELGASRLLAPYFSSSQIVWTIIIGTIMIAMALGNIYGGKSADRSPDPDKLYRRILIAAIWIALIPVVGKYIILGISALLIFTVSSNFLIIAAFVACMVIFVFPLFLLGTVTPSLVKYSVDSLDDSGKTVGTLGAFNTIGSIIGTFVPTFVTIPAVGTSITFLIFAGILIALAAVYFLSSHRGQKKVAARQLSYKLKIIGGGPLLDELKTLATGTDIEFLGYKQWPEIKELVGCARFCIIPSEWYENNPLSVIEAQCLGTPVLGACIGGIPELIEEGKSGMLFKSKDIVDLKKKIEMMFTYTFDYESLAKKSQERYSADAYYKQLMKIYTK